MGMPFTASEEIRKRWGEWFQDALKQTGESQERFAAKIGRSRQQVIRWKSGEALPDPEVLPTVAMHLGKGLAETYRMAGQVGPRLDARERDELWLTDMHDLLDNVPLDKRPRVKEAVRELLVLAS